MSRAAHFPESQRAALVALLSLPGLGPARLAALLERFGEPRAAWEAVRAGRLGDLALPRVARRHELVERWRHAARRRGPEEVLEEHRSAGLQVLVPSDPDWPETLVDDPDPPAALFVRGDTSLLSRVSVAVVGTRRCTAAGAAIARDLGAGLAAASVPVVSGLAVGIDGAAHRGVLGAGGRPVGVVATGLDVVYPRRHTDLWAAVGADGVLVSEAALGVGVERWRFPCRNRLVAAFSAAVVVVESARRGGSLSTVDAAQQRGVPVLAVPGSVRSEPSAGTNQLLFDGAGLVRDAADVLGELGTAVPLPAGDAPEAGHPLPPTLSHDPFLAAVLEALSPTGTGVAELVDVLGAPVVRVTTALVRLEAAGAARRTGAGYRRVVR